MAQRAPGARRNDRRGVNEVPDLAIAPATFGGRWAATRSCYSGSDQGAATRMLGSMTSARSRASLDLSRTFAAATISSDASTSSNSSPATRWAEGEDLSGAPGPKNLRALPFVGSGRDVMRPHRYELIVYWSADDAVFVVEVPELPGCVAHGPTPSKAVENADDAVELWVETARADGRSVPEPRTRRATIA